MSLVSPSQSSPGGEITAAAINTPINQLAAVVNGGIDATNIAASAIGTSQVADGSVTAAKLASSAITLGYTQITSNVTASSAGGSQAAGLTVTVTIPTGGRRIKITAYSYGIYNSTATNSYGLSLWDGIVGSGTQLQSAQLNNNTGAAGAQNLTVPITITAIVTPAAGSKTYNVGMFNSASGTLTLQAAATSPAFILVEAI